MLSSLTRALLASVLVLPCLACTDLASSKLTTSGMSAYITVVADGSGNTTATAQLNVDESVLDFVTLSPGDKLVAKVAGQDDVMSEVDVANDVSYVASFVDKGAQGTLYEVSLNRTRQVSALDSTCAIPAPFTLLTPAPAATLSLRAPSVTVTYRGAGTTDTMSYSTTVSCPSGSSTGDLSLGGDTGSFEVLTSDILPPGTTEGPCTVEISLSRASFGSLDPALSGGTIQCEQERSVTFTLAE